MQIQLFLIFLWAQLCAANLNATKSIILLGPPGSGKGTQGELLMQALNIPSFGFGLAFRAEKVLESETHAYYGTLKGAAKSNFKRELILKKLAKESRSDGLIFDSWPRSVGGLRFLADNYFRGDAPLVIEFTLPQEALVSRATSRLVCPNVECGASFGASRSPIVEGLCDNCGTALYKRPRDNEIAFPKRVAGYQRKREKMYRHYAEMDLTIHKIDANQDPHVIHGEIIELVKEYGLKASSY